MRPALCPVAFVCAVVLSACDDPVDNTRPARASAASAVLQEGPAGASVAEPPALEVKAAGGRPIAGVSVTFVVERGGGTITGGEAVTDGSGVARVGSWTLGAEPGANRVIARVPQLPDVEVVFHADGLPGSCARLQRLNQAPGGFVRLKHAAQENHPCLLFDATVASGHQYLVLFENMPLTGSFDASLFAGTESAAEFAFTLRSEPMAAGAPAARAVHAPASGLPAGMSHAWDFGAGPIYEYEPPIPPGGVAPARVLDGKGGVAALSAADPAIGDTLLIGMAGIPRLGIAIGTQKAVVRFISSELIIAEDVRLSTTLTRSDGGFNTPLTGADMAAIAAEYAALAKVQGDLLFQNRYNQTIENRPLRRVTAVHSLTPADDIWGYTYPIGDYFVWDFWVGTDGVTRGLNQHPQRVADNLFAHEIAHMRHWGLLERAGISTRGQRWLVEGFARFAERHPIAMRLLGTTAPSRTANVVLPRNPAFNNAYFRDDVPTFLNAGTSAFGGYQHSGYVFDYFADQVALAGGDWRTAIREFVTAAGTHASLNTAIAKWLPGLTFADLFTRARIALYTDDLTGATLPPWTQYHQFRLRESRPAGTSEALDPRNLWPKLSPDSSTVITHEIPSGGAFGYIIDGTGAASNTLFSITGSGSANALVSLVRIR